MNGAEREDVGGVSVITASRSKNAIIASDRQVSSQPPPSDGVCSTSTMVRFAVVFPDSEIAHALRSHLSWTYFRGFIAIDDPLKRQFYGHVPEAERTWLGPVPIATPARAIRDVIDTQLSPAHIKRVVGDTRHRGLISGTKADQLEARLRQSQRT